MLSQHCMGNGVRGEFNSVDESYVQLCTNLCPPLWFY